MDSTTSGPQPVLILATGGTIDKVYDRDGTLQVGPPAARWLLEAAGMGGTFDVELVLAKDSLDLTDQDRADLGARVRRITAGGVVITHGTDTMTLTADHLVGSGVVHPQVTVVLTGAMQPAAMRDSDAAFNLGAAITAAQLLAPGVYVAMSGRVFPAGQVVKDREAGRFVSSGEASNGPGRRL